MLVSEVGRGAKKLTQARVLYQKNCTKVKVKSSPPERGENNWENNSWVMWVKRTKRNGKSCLNFWQKHMKLNCYFWRKCQIHKMKKENSAKINK